MPNKLITLLLVLLALFSILIPQVFATITAQAAGSTSNVHIVKYASDGVTKLAEKTVSYEWMQKMLMVQGDGKTHYYHQGPIFEGDMWDPQRTANLKDKGAVEGTAVKDLCELVGGMNTSDEVRLVAVDGWHTEFAYSNIYTPIPQQGIITLCWYNGEESQEGGETSGIGYPGDNAYHNAFQIVFMSSIPNSEGKLVFGNSDMKAALPQEKYQHFYDGQYPSTNGLSGKWIAEIRIYSGGIQPGMKIDYTTANYPPTKYAGPAANSPIVPWPPIGLGIGGVLVGLFGFFVARSLGKVNLKIGAVMVVGVLLIVSAIIMGIHPWQNQPGEASQNWKLQLVGDSGQQKTLSLDEIQAMHSCSGHGGFFTTVGVVNGPYEAKGVLLTDLCRLVGGVTPSDVVMISAADGYSTVYDYDQVMGNFITYEIKTLKEVPHGELKTILMYQQNGQALSQDDGKPLRIAIVGTDGLLTEGNNWVKWVNKIEVLKPAKTTP